MMTQLMMVTITMQTKMMTIPRSNITTKKRIIMTPNRQRATTTMMMTTRSITSLARRTRRMETNRARVLASLGRVVHSINPNLAKAMNPSPVNLATSKTVSQERETVEVT
jgi:hypothetical protein